MAQNEEKDHSWEVFERLPRNYFTIIPLLKKFPNIEEYAQQHKKDIVNESLENPKNDD